MERMFGLDEVSEKNVRFWHRTFVCFQQRAWVPRSGTGRFTVLRLGRAGRFAFGNARRSFRVGERAGCSVFRGVRGVPRSADRLEARRGIRRNPFAGRAQDVHGVFAGRARDVRKTWRHLQFAATRLRHMHNQLASRLQDVASGL